MKIDGYEIEGELARGGMGVIYKAKDVRTDAAVVLKLLKLDSDHSRRRLAREAKAMARLSHPNLVPLAGTGEFEGNPYLVLPFVAGQSLQDRLDRGGPLQVEDAVRIGAQVAKALQAAHAQGLIHRDVKPANVLLDSSDGGAAKLTDFGLVKDVGPGQSQTVSLSVSGRFLGTPGYWPREQAHGQRDRIGPAADVYALGATLYALLCGDPPRMASTLVEVLQSFDHPVEPVRSRREDVPKWLGAVIDRCLRDEFEERPPLQAVIDRLERRGQRPAPPPRNVVRLAVSMSAVALLAIGLGLVLRQVRDSTPDPSPPAAAADPVDHEQTIAACTRAIKLDPDDAEALINRGLAREHLGRVDEAIEDYRLAFRTDPKDAGGLLARAEANRAMDNQAAAVEDCGLALELDPDSAAAYALRAEIRRYNQKDQALADYSRAIELTPNDPRPLLRRARLRAQDVHWSAEAIDDYTRALELQPKAAVFHARGLQEQRRGRHAEAIADFSRAIELDPRRPSSLDGSVVVHASHLNSLLELRRERDPPSTAESYLERARSQLALERYDEAIADFDRGLALSPMYPSLLAGRGEALLAAERPEAALASVTLAIKREQRDAYLLLRARCLEALGRHADAIADCERAFELDKQLTMAVFPDATSYSELVPKIHAVRGSNRAKLGRTAEAIEDFERALSMGLPAELKQQVDRQLAEARAALR